MLFILSPESFKVFIYDSLLNDLQNSLKFEQWDITNESIFCIFVKKLVNNINPHF